MILESLNELKKLDVNRTVFGSDIIWASFLLRRGVFLVICRPPLNIPESGIIQKSSGIEHLM